MMGRKNGEKTSTRKMTRTRNTRRRGTKVMLMWVKKWDSEDESSSSDDEGVASIAIQRASPGSCLFTNLTNDESDHIPTCLMEKGKKVPIETPPPSDDDKENMMKEFGEKGYKLIKRLMEKL